MTDYDSENRISERDRRRFAVSANRGKSSHRIRYVETGGAAVDNEECTFCQGVPVLDSEPEEVSGSESSANAERDRSRSRPSDDNAAQTDDADSGH